MAEPAAQLPAITLSPETQEEIAKKRAGATARRLIAEIGASERSQQTWLTRARRIVRKYRKKPRSGPLADAILADPDEAARILSRARQAAPFDARVESLQRLAIVVQGSQRAHPTD